MKMHVKIGFWPQDGCLDRVCVDVLRALARQEREVVAGAPGLEHVADMAATSDLIFVIDWGDRSGEYMGDALRHMLCHHPQREFPKAVFCSPLNEAEFASHFAFPAACETWRSRFVISGFPSDVYDALSLCQSITPENLRKTRPERKCDVCTVFQPDGHIPARQRIKAIGHRLSHILLPLRRWLRGRAAWPKERTLLMPDLEELSREITAAEGSFLPERERDEVARFLAETRTVTEWLKHLCSMCDPPKQAPEVVRSALENAAGSRACAIYGRSLRGEVKKLCQLGF